MWPSLIYAEISPFLKIISYFLTKDKRSFSCKNKKTAFYRREGADAYGKQDLRLCAGIHPRAKRGQPARRHAGVWRERKNIVVEKLSGKDFCRPRCLRPVRSLKEGYVPAVKSIDRLGRNYNFEGNRRFFVFFKYFVTKSILFVPPYRKVFFFKTGLIFGKNEPIYGMEAFDIKQGRKVYLTIGEDTVIQVFTNSAVRAAVRAHRETTVPRGELPERSGEARPGCVPDQPPEKMKKASKRSKVSPG